MNLHCDLLLLAQQQTAQQDIHLPSVFRPVKSDQSKGFFHNESTFKDPPLDEFLWRVGTTAECRFQRRRKAHRRVGRGDSHVAKEYAQGGNCKYHYKRSDPDLAHFEEQTEIKTLNESRCVDPGGKQAFYAQSSRSIVLSGRA